MKILFIGDIMGEPGRKTVARQVPRLVSEQGVDLVIGNAENAAGGFGITPDIARELFKAGLHVITTGNHVWDKKEIVDYIKDEPRLLRPANYPEGVPGRGSVVVSTMAGDKVGIVQLMGRVSMPTLDCPFRIGLWWTCTPRLPLKKWRWAGISMARSAACLEPTRMSRQQTSESCRKARHISRRPA